MPNATVDQLKACIAQFEEGAITFYEFVNDAYAVIAGATESEEYKVTRP